MERVQEKLIEPLQTIALSQAKRLICKGQYRLAEQGLLQVSHVGPPNAEVYHLLAVICARQGKFEEAATMWQTALELNPNNPEYLKGLDLCRSGESKVPLCRRPLKVGLAGAIVAIVFVGMFYLFSPWKAENNQMTAVPEQRPQVVQNEDNAAKNDADIFQSLQGISAVSRGDVSVRQNGGVIYVEGNLPTAYAYYTVSQKLLAMQGARSVDLSRLQVTNSLTVRPGDSLWIIAQEVYEDSSYWKSIAEKNRISAPYKLLTNQSLILP